MTTIEELQKIVNDETRSNEERREAAEHILRFQGQLSELDEESNRIADDDPEVSERRRVWLELTSVQLPLAEAKRRVADKRRSVRLKAIAGDQSRPMEERIRAAKDWRGEPSGTHWHHYDDLELVERLTPTPNLEKMADSARIAQDKQATVKSRFAAIDGYRRMRDEFPKRAEPDNRLLLDWGYDDLPGRDLAYEVGKRIAAKTGASPDYIAGIVRRNRGAEYDVPLADVATNATPCTGAKPEASRPQVTAEQITRYFDQKLAALDAVQRG